MARTELLIVDDHEIVREGLRLLLDGEPDLRVVGEAGDGEAGAAAAARLQPALVLLDMSMAGLGGAAAIARVRERCPSARVLVLSMNEDARYVRAALAAGADGYVAKRSGGATLVRAVRAVAAGERFLDPALPELAPEDPTSDLSAREREVAALIARGHTGPDIARTLGISKSSVDTYRARVLNKLGASSRAELIERLDKQVPR